MCCFLCSPGRRNQDLIQPGRHFFQLHCHHSSISPTPCIERTVKISGVLRSIIRLCVANDEYRFHGSCNYSYLYCLFGCHQLRQEFQVIVLYAVLIWSQLGFINEVQIMKKRLDIQSLLENSEKQDLVLFLKNAFTLHADLTDHFLIHFASKFELDEMDFQLIMDRIKHMIPNSLSEMTHRKANKVRDHIRDLIDQARDCQSREDYRQAFVIVSHVLRLLDQYSDLIAEKFRFHILPYQCYQLLDGIHRDSPAPELKSRMILFLHELIQEGK